jgi:hypothetical protein
VVFVIFWVLITEKAMFWIGIF